MRVGTPLVSVLMPVYNGMPYLPLAVESILNQTFNDFEFIIVNDCSTDSSIEYLHSLHDTRIVLVNLQQNVGVTGALQEGMKKVRGKYVARLDADDIAKPHRLQTQVNYLENNPKVGLLGSSFELIDSSGNLLKHVNLAKDDIEIRWRMLFKNPFFHSTVMFRGDLIRNHQLGYTRKHSEDYQLWVELLQFCKGIISCDKLIQYRTHQQSWTFTRGLEQVQAAKEIAANEINKYLIVEIEKIKPLVDYARGKSIDKSVFKEMEYLFVRLVRSFIKVNRCIAHRKFVLDRFKELRKRIGIGVVFKYNLYIFFASFFQIKVR